MEILDKRNIYVEEGSFEEWKGGVNEIILESDLVMPSGKKVEYFFGKFGVLVVVDMMKITVFDIKNFKILDQKKAKFLKNVLHIECRNPDSRTPILRVYAKGGLTSFRIEDNGTKIGEILTEKIKNSEKNFLSKKISRFPNINERDIFCQLYNDNTRKFTLLSNNKKPQCTLKLKKIDQSTNREFRRNTEIKNRVMPGNIFTPKNPLILEFFGKNLTISNFRTCALLVQKFNFPIKKIVMSRVIGIEIFRKKFGKNFIFLDYVYYAQEIDFLIVKLGFYHELNNRNYDTKNIFYGLRGVGLNPEYEIFEIEFGDIELEFKKCKFDENSKKIFGIEKNWIWMFEVDFFDEIREDDDQDGKIMIEVEKVEICFKGKKNIENFFLDEGKVSLIEISNLRYVYVDGFYDDKIFIEEKNIFHFLPSLPKTPSVYLESLDLIINSSEEGDKIFQINFFRKIQNKKICLEKIFCFEFDSNFSEKIFDYEILRIDVSDENIYISGVACTKVYAYMMITEFKKSDLSFLSENFFKEKRQKKLKNIVNGISITYTSHKKYFDFHRKNILKKIENLKKLKNIEELEPLLMTQSIKYRINKSSSKLYYMTNSSVSNLFMTTSTIRAFNYKKNFLKKRIDFKKNDSGSIDFNDDDFKIFFFEEKIFIFRCEKSGELASFRVYDQYMSLQKIFNLRKVDKEKKLDFDFEKLQEFKVVQENFIWCLYNGEYFCGFDFEKGKIVTIKSKRQGAISWKNFNIEKRMTWLGFSEANGEVSISIESYEGMG